MSVLEINGCKMFHLLKPTDMKALTYPLSLAIFAFLLSSCFSTQGNLYSQGYNEYGYDNGNSYFEDNSYSYSNDSRISFNVFYNELRPYGRWINNGQYGRVWIPNVGRDFHPYATNGYWVMTDYGNTWVSNYSWGWAPFHYGRWFLDDYYGWCWMPGYEWAPAWVTWRSGGGYYGWAPMTPGIHINININLPGTYWTFIPHNRMYHRNIHRYYSRYSPKMYNKTTIINNTYIYNNNRYYSGPSSRDYERNTGRKVTVHRLESSNNSSGRTTQIRNNTVSVFRPDASATRSGSVEKPSNTQSTSGRTTTGSSNVERSNNRTSQPSSTTRATSTTHSNETSKSAGTVESSNNGRNTRSTTTVNTQRSTSVNNSETSTVRSSSRSSGNNNRSSSNSRSSSSNESTTRSSSRR